MISPALFAVIVLSGILSAGGAVLFLRRRRPAEPSLPHEQSDQVVFLFDGTALADATTAARAMLPPSAAGMDDWGRFLLAFGNRFENLAGRIAEIDCGRSLTLTDPADPDSGIMLQVQKRGEMIRVALVDQHAEDRSQLLERYSMMAMRAELETLRSIAEDSPVATWRKRHDGTIVWANAAYMSLTLKMAGTDALFAWPPQDLFGAAGSRPAPEGGSRRVSISSQQDDRTLWFDLTSRAVEDGHLFFATPIDGLVRAESALSGFVQTLTKTFAHLTVGLAIFDRKRRLVLFNPALVDLTGLPAEQLSTQPTLHSFLDALRERQRIPEPKDYKSWRLQIAQLEAAAADGTYAQNWHLPNGQTYRVTGRPHPDGAVAYLFEDISSEVTLNRSFRSEIETGRAVLDTLEEAIAVFSANGILMVANTAYAELWKIDHADRAAETSLSEALHDWAARCAEPDEALLTLGGLLADGGTRRSSSRDLDLGDSRQIVCRVRPLTGGATMIAFRSPDAAAHNLDVAPRSRVGT